MPHVLKICLLAILFHVANPLFSQSGVTSSSYKEVLIEVNGCAVLFKNTYTRKNLFTRTTAYVTNTTDRYVIFDARRIFLISEKSGKLPCLYDVVYVIPPQATKKFNLKFPAKSFGSETVAFEVASIDFEEDRTTGYEKQQVAVKPGETLTWENIHVEILNTNMLSKNLVIELRLKYKGKGFLKINHDKIALQFPDQNLICFNAVHPEAHAYYNPVNRTEDIVLLFPVECIPENGRHKQLLFENVFIESPLTTQSGGYVSAAKLSEGSTNFIVDKEEEKEEHN